MKGILRSKFFLSFKEYYISSTGLDCKITVVNITVLTLIQFKVLEIA